MPTRPAAERCAQRRIGAALDDAEQAVARRGARRRPCERSAQRSDSSMARATSAARGRQGDALVEHHGDGGIEQMLDLDRALGRQLVPAAVEVRAEHDAALVELAPRRQRHDLIAAGIGQDRAGPSA